MGLSIGIVGLPNVGKSTLFKALTKKAVAIAPYPFTTIHPNIGIAWVKDERLEKIAKIINPQKITPASIEFVDIAGLVKGAHKGEGLGNQFLAEIRNCDAILIVVRGFFDERVESVLGGVEPEKEIEVLKTELLMKDLETINNIIAKLEPEKRTGTEWAVKKIALLEKIKNALSRGQLISQLNLNIDEKKEIQEYQFLTQKPSIIVINCGKVETFSEKNFALALNLKEEAEIAELSPSDLKELILVSHLDKLILKCYNILNLITFFTVAGQKEARAWSLNKGANILEAAEKVHSDFKEKFIRAEVVGWKQLVEAKSWAKAREKGFIQIVGKDYIVKDGDVIEFKI